MFGLEASSSKEKQAEETEVRIQEIERQLAAMKRESDELLEAVDMTEEEFDLYMSKPEHFIPSDWEEIQTRMQALEEQLKQTLEKARNPKKSFERFQDTKEVRRTWLFCR